MKETYKSATTERVRSLLEDMRRKRQEATLRRQEEHQLMKDCAVRNPIPTNPEPSPFIVRAETIPRK